MMGAPIARGIGLAGTAAILFAYLLLQTGRLGRSTWMFLLLNLLGAAGILYSLAFRFNLAATLIESAWFTISFYGIVRKLARRQEAGS